MTDIDDVAKLLEEVVRVYKGQDTKLSRLAGAIYADSSMREVKKFAFYFQGCQTTLEEMVKYLSPGDVAVAIFRGKIEEMKTQHELLYKRYLAILAERRERRRQRGKGIPDANQS